jgi:hypothetical protein
MKTYLEENNFESSSGSELHQMADRYLRLMLILLTVSLHSSLRFQVLFAVGVDVGLLVSNAV